MVGKELVPTAIEEYLAKNNYEGIYWNRTEYLDGTKENDFEYFGEIYLQLRGSGKDLSLIGKKLYEKGEKRKMAGFEQYYYQQNN
jgi:hypothetical protein